MRLDQPCILFAFLVLIMMIAIPAMAKERKEMLFGVNYLPQVTCVEDFRPYWRADNWTEKRMITDMKIMKAIGCSCIRFPIYPAVPGQIQSWGVPAEKFLPMLDLGVKTAGELGILVHLDIGDEVEERGEEGVRFCLSRYKGKIQSYQLGNECYHWPESPERLKWLQGLIELGHSIDPDAIISADILVPDWVKIRDENPKFYKELDVALAHYYSVTDHRGWNQLYIDDLVDYLSNPTGRYAASERKYDKNSTLKDRGAYDANYMGFDHDFYAGSFGWLDKEVWLSETTSHGYWRWGSLVPEAKRAADWENIVDSIADAENRVTRIYHWCFRDKMSNREFGMGYCGIVHYDGSPRTVTGVFKKMAAKYAPKGSALASLDCDIARLDVSDKAKTADLKIKLTNKTDAPIKGKFTLELPDNTTAGDEIFNFSIPAKADKSYSIPVDVSGINWGANHTFARVEIPQGLLYGWGIIAKPKHVEVSPVSPLGEQYAHLVRYPAGIEAVQEFLDKYGDKCAIITGPGLGTDNEMGFRLKTVLQAMRCSEIQMRSSVLAIDMLDRPIIVIGTPEYNLISKTVEMALKPDLHTTALKPGEGFVNVVKDPFGKPTGDGKFSRQSEQIGYFFGVCPAALYIAGPDDRGTEAAAYDLIGRIWGKDEKYR